ncbi:MAG: methionine biosynthesis protein MetW [Alphaproteobacteria bacterium]
MSDLRSDLALIAGLVPEGARVLDVGCGDGALLRHLVTGKGVTGRGLELSAANVSACLAKGLSVVQGDADTDLADYPDNAFDVVILSQTIQATRSPGPVLGHLLRIGRSAVVSFANFGHWRARLRLLGGRMPVPGPSESWHATANLHPCTVKDFVALCGDVPAPIAGAWALGNGAARAFTPGRGLANLRAETAVFLLGRSAQFPFR